MNLTTSPQSYNINFGMFHVVIEKNIPMSPRNRRSAKAFSVFKAMIDPMEIGDSFLIAPGYIKRVAGYLYFYNSEEKTSGRLRKLSQRKQPDGMRIWRVK